jgi:hypothetical protein
MERDNTNGVYYYGEPYVQKSYFEWWSGAALTSLLEEGSGRYVPTVYAAKTSAEDLHKQLKDQLMKGTGLKGKILKQSDGRFALFLDE